MIGMVNLDKNNNQNCVVREANKYQVDLLL